MPGLCDERPDEFPESELHWHYKWVAGWATEFVEIDRKQLSQLFDDMEARFRKRGLGQDAVLKIRTGAADHLGDDAEIETLLGKWRASRRDVLSDCQPCDLNEQVRLLLVLAVTTRPSTSPGRSSRADSAASPCPPSPIHMPFRRCSAALTS